MQSNFGDEPRRRPRRAERIPGAGLAGRSPALLPRRELRHRHLDRRCSFGLARNETLTKAEKSITSASSSPGETVDLRIQAISLLSHSGNSAGVQVTYSMTFKYFGQAPRSRSDIIEKYDLVCNATSDWLIKYNLDETNLAR